jgi:antagonist of KipI
LANLLVGNEKDEAVLEMHFPAPLLYFPKGATISLTGADFSAMADGHALPLNRKIILPAGANLQFSRKLTGQRCYLGVAGGWQLSKVMGSYSTHVKAGFGGWQGRALQKSDTIPLRNPPELESIDPKISKWFVYTDLFYAKGPIRVVPGPEWDWLSYAAKKAMLNESFIISRHSDRMGYHVNGPVIQKKVNDELLSSGVLPGTMQLLPNGNSLLLMADCQTTGGYPRILQVARVDMPRLAQMGAGESLQFEIIDVAMAKELLQVQVKCMQSLPNALALL